jgi:hypothetical protein
MPVPRRAGRQPSAQPQALTLRYLQTMLDISTEKSSTILFPVPIDLMSSFKEFLASKKD